MLCLQMQAQTSIVKNLIINVKLQENGDAKISEIWDIELNKGDAKTEWYVSHNNIGAMQIKDLGVTGFIPGKGYKEKFQTLDNWNIEATREEKAGKCGLTEKNEISWGFGDWGRHLYVVSYTLTNLVQAYDTKDGFNHCFFDMNCQIDSAGIVFFPPEGIKLNDSNTKKYAFGFEGSTWWKDSVVVAMADSTCKKMIILLEFDKKLFKPAITSEKKWADVKKMAMEGSSYEEEEKKDDNNPILNIVL